MDLFNKLKDSEQKQPSQALLATPSVGGNPYSANQNDYSPAKEPIGRSYSQSMERRNSKGNIYGQQRVSWNDTKEKLAPKISLNQ